MQTFMGQTFLPASRGITRLFCNCLLALMTWSAQGQTNVPPVIIADGEQIYCPLSTIRIATSFNIVDPDDTEVEAFYIQISTGYEIGEDILRLENSHPQVTTAWNQIEGKLEIKGPSGGPVAYTDLTAAVNDVVFESTSERPTTEKYISFTIGSANYLPETGHYYEYVPDIGIRWDEAKIAAENRTFFGLQGYLVTITSQAEAQLAGEQAAGTGWIGGSDAETEGVWRWVTGPETGQVFWNGDFTGSSPNYAFWNNQEPNNLIDEDYAHITAPNIGIAGSWNDLPIAGDEFGDFQPKGYIVEYGGLPGDPVLTLSASTKISTPQIVDFSSETTCGPGNVTLTAQASIGEVVWFDTETGGIPLGMGDTLETPLLDAIGPNTFYATASYNGCLTGERVPVDAIVKQKPVINDGFTISNCDMDGLADGFTNFDLTQYLHLIRQDHENFTITFHLNENDAENGLNFQPGTLFNNSITNEIYFRLEGTGDYCYSVGRLFLDVTTTSFSEGYEYELGVCDDLIEDGIAIFNLEEAEADLIAQFPSGQNLSVSFYQNEEDAFLGRNEIINTGAYINITPFSERIYVRVDDEVSATCYAVGQHLLLTVFPIPTFELDEGYLFCSNGMVKVTPLNAKDNYGYVWYNENNEVIGNEKGILISKDGTYSVEAISENNCTSPPVFFSVQESGPPTFTTEFVQIEDSGERGTITVLHENGELGLGLYEFSLDSPFGPYKRDGVFTNVEPGLHTIFATDVNGCGSDQIKVGVIGVPKFFTPNNDGYNDELKVLGLSSASYESGVLFIYDRYGKLLTVHNPMQDGWNGFYNGQPLPPSDYWFVLELKDVDGIQHRRNGHFTLKQ